MVAAVEAAGSPEDASVKARYFQAFPGGYGEGDEFAGVSVPAIRALVRRFRSAATVSDAVELLQHRYNEVRLLGGLLLVELYRTEPEAAMRATLDNRHRLNNWNLVDAVVRDTIGAWLLAHPSRRTVLDELVVSENLWDRRIALISTFALLRAGEHDDTLRLCAAVLDDRHDLIHKAAGWMLREVGQRDRAVLDGFLERYAARMPRTMLSYAIEKHTPAERTRLRAKR
ncbi:DNA alkylation repair protein [Kineosporia succinea]|nr:DNA alkylation repair protein [Kineosporia succinea]